mgnify:FL=1|jgi:hypothetical protein
MNYKIGIIEKMLNQTEANELFENEAILLCGRNAIPYYRVVELFGETAAIFIESNQKYNGYLTGGLDYNSCGACTEKRPLLSYLLKPGFLKVVSEHNYFIALQKHKESNGGQLIDKYFKERYRRMKEQDEADRKKAEERKAKRAAARAKKQQLTA